MSPNPKPKDADQDLITALDSVTSHGPCECGDYNSLPDTYTIKHQAGPPVWRPDGTCSWCGSLSPEYVITRLANATAEWEPSTKNYKGYLRPARGCTPLASPSGKFYLWHFSPEQVSRLNAAIRSNR